MFIQVVKKALDEKRTFILAPNMSLCATWGELLVYLPTLLNTVDKTLFNGGLIHFLNTHNISLKIKQSHKGPAGVTTYDTVNGMNIHLNANAWISPASSGMVGGNTCQRPDKCIAQTFLHEIIHVVLFCIYIELDMSQQEVEAMIPTHFDPTHNVIFTTWLKQFFKQNTIDNSLLLRSVNEPLQFTKGVIDIERVCLLADAKIQVFYQGVWQDAILSNNQENIKPHHSRIQILQGQRLIVPNGLLRC